MTCRDATLDDASAIGRIHVAAWRAAYAGEMPAAFLAGLDPAVSQRRWEQGFHAARWPNGIIVVEADRRVAGFCVISPSRDADAAADTGEVVAINLDPTAWRRGLGTELLREALSRLAARGYVQATLWVLERNARARAFYEANGWRADGAEKVERQLTGFPLHEVRYRIALETMPRSI